MEVSSKVPRIEYRKILYTTDLSESGRCAFPHAASIAKCYGADLTVLHVVEGGPELDRRLFGYVDEALWEEIKTRNLQEARNILISRRRDNAAIRDYVGEFHGGTKDALEGKAYVTYTIEVQMGDPVEKIIECSEQGNYDLIVVGSHGHGVLRGALMGNTAKQVVSRSKIPVLVVRVPREED